MMRPQLLMAAQRYVDGDDADDVVQDALLRLWQMLDELHLPINALATVLVRNQCISLLRKQRHTVILPAANVPDDLPVSAAGAAENENIDLLMDIIESLPSMQQTILRLRHMEGMEMSDIAELTSSNEVAVRKALSRARQAVRIQFLKQDHQE